jgi:hypothetical protein
MSIPPRVSRWLTVQTLCALLAASVPAAAPTPAAANDALRIALRPPGVSRIATPDLVAELDRWLDGRIDWPARALPEIRYITPREAARIGGAPDRGLGAARGLYDPDSGTIFLVTPWSADRPQDVSVLLHELVHHRQAPHHFYCDAAQEPAAYRAQAAWLADRGTTLEVNWLALTLAAGCTPRDIHP